MSDVLREYLGHNVEIWSRSGEHSIKDAGLLVAYDENWIKIQKPAMFGEEILLFPIANIRLLKPVA